MNDQTISPKPASQIQSPKKENSLVNIAFNIVIPVLVLNKAGKYIGPFPALVIALAFPILYWIYDLLTRKKFNYISVLGFLNILFTGGLALAKVTGVWFAVKEAAFPTLIGIFVFASAFTKNPFIRTLLLDPSMMNTEILEAKLRENNLIEEFKKLLKKSTLLLSGSFALSALLNFFLAAYIFKDIDPGLTEEQASEVLNGQIANMTTLSMPIIMIPSMIFLFLIMVYLISGIKKMTGMSLDDLVKQS